MKQTLLVIGSILFVLTVGACSRDYSTAPNTKGSTTWRTTPGAHAKSANGAASQMPALYDGDVFIINSKELSETASGSIIARNPSHNEIYATNDLDDEQDFLPVLDAIQGDGFNPLWDQILIVFNPGFPPHQFTSDDEIEKAAAGDDPEITLVHTNEVYRCSVVGAAGRHTFAFRADNIGVIAMTGGGVFDPRSGFVVGAGDFRCASNITTGPLAGLQAGEGIRWKATELLTSSGFKCVAADVARTAVTDENTVVMNVQFFRDGTSASLTAKVFVSAVDENPDLPGSQNVWIQQVGCDQATVNLH